MKDLYELLRADDAREELISYGVDPTVVEEFLAAKPLHYQDKTADLAIARADRELARKRRAAR